jgi:hypothetical protein
MRNGYFCLLGFCFVVAWLLSGCQSDPVVRNAIVELRGGAVVIMDEHDRMAVEAGKAPLPKEYRDEKTGAYDDILNYLDGKKPAPERWK